MSPGTGLSMFDRFLAALSTRVIRHRALVLVGIAGLLALSLAVSVVRGFKADFSPQALFTTYTAQQTIDAEFVAQFGKTENVVLYVVEGDDVLSPQGAAFIHALSLDVADEPFVERTESITLASVPRAGAPGELRVDPPIAGDTVEPEELAELRDALVDSGLLRGTLIAEDRRVAIVAAFLGADETRIEEVRPVIARLREIAAAHPPPPGFGVELAGIPNIRIYVVERMLGDQAKLIPLSVLVSTLMLLFTFRWVVGVAGANAAVGFSILVMFGGMAACAEPFNIMNQMLPILLIIIGMNDAIHLVSRYVEEFHACGDRLEAARRTLRAMTVACFLTSFTTAVGFGTLIVSRTELLQRFGVTAAIAVMAAYVVTLLFLPAALSYAPRPTAAAQATHDSWLDTTLERIVLSTIRNPRRTLLLWLVPVAIGGFFASRVVVDTRLLEIFPEGNPIHTQVTMLERELDGILPFEVFLRADETGRFDDPALLNALDQAAAQIRTFDGVLSVTSYSDLLHETWVAWSDDPARRTQPFTSEAQIAQLASLLEGGDDLLGEYVRNDRTALRINIQVADIGSRAAVVLAEQIRAELDPVIAEHPGTRYDLTGDAYSGTLGLNSLIRDMSSNLGLAMIIIFGTMTLLFRSLRMGLISVPPNLVPLIGTAAWMGARGIYLNTTTVIVFSVAIGLAVDDTIHMMSRFKEELPGAKGNVDEALRRAARGSGRAVIMTSMMLLGGLSVMLLSTFMPIRWFSELMATTIFFALLGDLLLLPALLKRFWPEGRLQ